MFGKSSNANQPNDGVAYRNVRLVEDRSVDLFIHHSRGKGIWSYNAWLEEGRPRELASLNLATWSLLTTSVKEYQLGLRQAAARVYVRMVLPMYVVWIMCTIGLTSNSSVTEDLISVVITFGFLGMIVASLMVSSCYQQQYVDQVFNPAVQSVLDELEPKLTEAGYEVTLMVETGAWCVKPTKAFLRFTPLPDVEKAASSQD
jgi:hypothetical protein